MKFTVAHKRTLDPDCKGERQSTARLSVVPFSRPFPEQVFLHDHMTVCVMPKVVTAQRIQNLYICSALVLAVFSVRYELFPRAKAQSRHRQQRAYVLARNRHCRRERRLYSFSRIR